MSNDADGSDVVAPSSEIRSAAARAGSCPRPSGRRRVRPVQCRIQPPYGQAVWAFFERAERHGVVARHVRQPVEPADVQRRIGVRREPERGVRDGGEPVGVLHEAELGHPKSTVQVKVVSPTLPSTSAAATCSRCVPFGSPKTENLPSLQSFPW